ncbi:MAG: alpha/beta hydrolase [Leptolyngbyaceae cyanobacterium]
MPRSLTRQEVSAFLGGLTAIALGALPTAAAETVVFDFGPFSRSVAVDDLTAYAEQGDETSDLAQFLSRLSPERQADLRQALTAEREADVVALSRWYYAPMGERTLQFVGRLFPTGARLNGQMALRAAIISAAAEDGQTSALDIMRHYPTEVLRVDLPLLIRSTREVIAEADRALAVVEAVKQASQTAAAANPLPDLSGRPDLIQPGPYSVQQQDLTLQDAARGDRTYPATLFWPQRVDPAREPWPVLVLSHGLGDTRSSFFDIARHVASHGFAVALPDHVGSNLDYRQALFAGLTDEYFDARDFLNRPLDITFLLDELERLNATQYQGRLNLEQVAVAGHSFGEYTVLALGGATIDFARLTERCDPNANIVIDAAMVLECRALELQDDPAIV